MQYDHLEFPGVVPRTFIGALTVSALSAPAVFSSDLAGGTKLHSQFIGNLEHLLLRLEMKAGDCEGNFGNVSLCESAVRIVLGTLVLGAFAFFRGAVHRKFGFRVSQVLAVLTLSQFHFLFYASRTLPNTFALALGETTQDPSLFL